MRAVPALLMLVLWLGTGGSVASETLAPHELPETSIHYRIEASLDPETREISGLVELIWRSPAAGVLGSVPIHLYLNAFSHQGTTWMAGAWQGRRPGIRSLADLFDDPWGYIELDRVTQDGESCPVQFIQPDDGNPLDRSLAEVTLASPLAPGETLRLSMSFRARLPIPMARTGGRDDYFHVAQWFPKIGVYESAGVRGRSDGGWAARQFHGPTEFYADFADWEVTLDVPTGYTLLATGEGEEIETQDSTRSRWRFGQRAVHDFAFVAAVGMHVETHPHVPKGGGAEVAITYATPSEVSHRVPRMRRVAEKTFDVMGQRVGPYPFSTMTIVEPHFKAAATSGMEYPTLVTGGFGDRLFDLPGLRDSGFNDGVIAHEIIHNYFQGMVANDEQEEPFLDEGFTSYWEEEVSKELRTEASEQPRVFGRRVDRSELRELAIGASADRINEAVLRRPANLFYPGTLGTQVYSRTLDIFRTAAALHGQDEVDRIFSTFFRRYRFRHPGQEDFFGVVAEVASSELNAFLQEAYLQPRIPDYAVVEAESERWLPPLGLVPTEDGRVLVTPRNREGEEPSELGLDPAAKEADGRVQMIVSDPGFVAHDDRRDGHVTRRSVHATRAAAVAGYEPDEDEFYATLVRLRGPQWRTLPVEVRFRFVDGAEVLDIWDGRAAWREYRFVRRARLHDVLLDPDDKLAVDSSRKNDGRRIEPDRSRGNDWGTWLTAVVAWFVTGAAWWL